MRGVSARRRSSALLRHIFLELGGDDSEVRDELYSQFQRHSTEDRSFSEILKDLWALWKAVAVQFVLLLLAVLLIAAGFMRLLGIDAALAQGLVVAAAVGSLPFLGRYLLNPVPWRANVTRLDLPRTTAEQYEEFLKGRLVRYREESPGVERLVVFVDDLDRLPAEEMVDGLDAVRGFMGIPGEAGGEAPGVVFVVSCDEGKVAEALADRRRRNDSQLPATISGKEDARRYLDRIFQFRLEVPPPPKRDMRGYARSRLKEDLSIVAEDLEERGFSLDEVVDRMIHPGVQSPRTAVHMLNAFARSWWLAHHRELTGGATRPGGLREGAVTDHPQTLAALAALQVDFPEFYDDLEEHPGLLDAFSEVFVDGMPAEDQPTGLHDLLEGYRLDGQDRDEVSGNRVKPRHRALRSFVSGLRGLRRPRNLRPLLELAQDQLSRNLGPREEEARVAFVEADTRGVLESLGRANDDRPLTAEQVARLKDVVEDTEGETPARRDNGGVVLAEIADRLPPERGRGLLDPLAFRLRNSRDLRSRVGVTGIASLIPRLRRDDQIDLAGTLVEDNLRAEGDILLETPNLQTPSLEDAIGIARATVEVVLAVRGRFGLSSESDQALLQWLAVRRVSSGGESYEFPFSDLETWVARHEENLLPALGARYAAAVAAAIGREGLSKTDTVQTARRSREIFARLAAGGRQDHAALWDHLTAFVSAEDPEVARAGWEFAASDPSTADTEHINAFVGALADRTSEAGEFHEGRDAVAPSAGAALVDAYRSRAGDVEDEVHGKLAELARNWGATYYEDGGRDLGRYAAALTETLANAKSSHFSQVFTDWAGRLLGNLNPTCRRWVASFVPRLNEAERANVAQGLAEISTENSVEEDVAEKYAEFISALDPRGLGTEEISNHLRQVAQRAADLTYTQGQGAQLGSAAVISQAESYLAHVLPALAPVVEHVPAENAVEMLERAFVDGWYVDHSHPLFARLHAAMVDRWPPSADMPYPSEDVFNQAEEVAKKSPQIDDAPAIVRSMVSLADANGLGAGFSRRVLDTACALWPYHQEFVLDTLTSSAEAPPSGSLAALATETEPNSAEEASRLSAVWTHGAAALSADGAAEVADALLGRPPDEEASDPDWALGLWLRTSAEGVGILRRYFEDPNVADEDLERLWARAVADAKSLGPPFFRSLLPVLFAREDAERMISAVTSDRDRITSLFDGPSARNELGRGLLESLVASRRNSDKGFLAQWIEDASAGGSLGHLNNLDPSDADLKILRQVFPTSSRLEGLVQGRNTS